MSLVIDVLPVLERFILQRAPAHFPSATAPDSYEKLLAWQKQTGGVGHAPLPVWDGASDKTIYSSPAVNYAARAWHDSTHLQHGYDFSLSGELSVGELQELEVREALGGWGEIASLIIRADTRGQTIYQSNHGFFPEDQAAFCVEYVNRDARALNITNAFNPQPINWQE